MNVRLLILITYLRKKISDDRTFFEIDNKTKQKFHPSSLLYPIHQR